MLSIEKLTKREIRQYHSSTFLTNAIKGPNAWGPARLSRQTVLPEMLRPSPLCARGKENCLAVQGRIFFKLTQNYVLVLRLQNKSSLKTMKASISKKEILITECFFSENIQNC